MTPPTLTLPRWLDAAEPRALDEAVARFAVLSEADEATRDLLRTLVHIAVEQGKEIAALRRQVRDINHRETV